LKRTWVLAALLAGCGTRAVAPPHWDAAAPEVQRLWHMRSAQTHSCALLASAEYTGPPGDRSFTLEIFFREPDLYLLRGRGTLGVEGFRARVQGDSITVLLERQKRGYRGLARELPDASAREMWRLLGEALPWVVGEDPGPETAFQMSTVQSGSRPEHVQVESDGARLDLQYARYRADYPYWHLREVQGERAGARIRLEIRQQLYNPDLDSTLFELNLPAGTLPLLD